jgi:hypothetical protein
MNDNDEARMMNDEGMTKSEYRKSRAEDLCWGVNPDFVVREESETKRVYDLEERTAQFGEVVIDFVKTIPQNAVTNRIISQLVGAATSVGANYVEGRRSFQKRIPEKHWNLPKGSARNQAFPSDDRSGGSGIEAPSSNTVA